MSSHTTTITNAPKMSGMNINHALRFSGGGS
jgi:hypothetical protein